MFFHNGNPQMTAMDRSQPPEAPNLTNPKRVKKLTKFFGDDPPLLRLFLRKLGYEVIDYFFIPMNFKSPLIEYYHTSINKAWG